MENSIIFLGKFDEDLLSLEAKILSFKNDFNKTFNKLNNKYKVLNNPDVINYSIQDNYNAWVLLGDVKPTLLLKNLISEAKIIIFVFNLSKIDETLNFLDKGWGGILARIDLNVLKEKKKFLIGTNSTDIDKIEIIKKIRPIMTKFKCEKYYEYLATKDTTIIKEKITIFSNVLTILEKGEQNIPIKSRNSTSTYYNYSSYADDYDDDNDQDNDNNNEIITKEIQQKFKDSNSIQYNLFQVAKKAKAHLIESPKAKGQICLQKYIEYKSTKFFIRRICNRAFSNTAIEELSFADDSKLRVIENEVFDHSKIQRLFIPPIHLTFHRFWCKGADELVHIEVDPKCHKYLIENGCLIFRKRDKNNRKKILAKKILFAPRKSDNSNDDDDDNRFNFDKDFVVPKGVTHIGSCAFYHCQLITSLQSETRSLSFINSFAFFECSILKKVCIKKANVLNLNDSCFLGSNKLRSIEIECNKLKIGKNCFSGCSELSSVKISKASEIKMKLNAFDGCNLQFNDFIPVFVKGIRSLESLIILGENELKITSNAFNKFLSKLKKISIISSSLRINFDDSSFDNTNIQCIELICEELYLNDKHIENCNYKSFIIELLNDNKRKTLEIENTGDKMLLRSNNKSFIKELLMNINLISNNEVNLTKNLVSNLDNLEIVNIKTNKVFVEKECFKNSSSIKEFIIDESQEVKLDKSAFKQCENLKTVRISENISTTIGVDCFAKCNKLTNPSIPQSANYQKKSWKCSCIP